MIIRALCSFSYCYLQTINYVKGELVADLELKNSGTINDLMTMGLHNKRRIEQLLVARDATEKALDIVVKATNPHNDDDDDEDDDQ